MKLTPGFTVVDYQATPSGYYQISFRHPLHGTITCTQHGRGGCNLYTPYNVQAELFKWLDGNAQMAIDAMNEMGFPDLASCVEQRESEWYDIVVMAIADAIELKRVRVEG